MTADEFLANWKKKVDEKGIVIFQNSNLSVLDSLLFNAGTIITATDIKVRENTSRYIHSSKSIPLHTEQPEADFLVWFCQEQSEEGGCSYIVDGNDVFKALSDFDLQQLCNIKCKINTPVSDASEYPVLEIKDDIPHWYWVPWVGNSADSKTLPVLSRLIQTIDNTSPFTFRMKKNDIVIIDNRRMFHARDSYKGQRLLRRFLINKYEH